MKHTICFGEVLVDLLSNKLSQNSNEHEAFTKFAGGAPANVSVAIAKLGGNAYFAGMLSTDSFGDFLHNALKEQGVKTDFMRFTNQAKQLSRLYHSITMAIARLSFTVITPPICTLVTMTLVANGLSNAIFFIFAQTH
jgi:sugar/nucleoside kinase (ribokinase family)